MLSPTLPCPDQLISAPVSILRRPAATPLSDTAPTAARARGGAFLQHGASRGLAASAELMLGGIATLKRTYSSYSASTIREFRTRETAYRTGGISPNPPSVRKSSVQVQKARVRFMPQCSKAGESESLTMRRHRLPSPIVRGSIPRGHATQTEAYSWRRHVTATVDNRRDSRERPAILCGGGVDSDTQSTVFVDVLVAAKRKAGKTRLRPTPKACAIRARRTDAIGVCLPFGY